MGRLQTISRSGDYSVVYFGKRNKKKKVLISVPNLGWIHKYCVFAILKLQSDIRYDKNIILPTHIPFENNLHHIINDFLAGNYDFWLSFDADNPPTRNPLDLIEYDKDIIGFPTPVWHFTGKAKERPVYWNGYDYVPESRAYKEHLPREGLQRVSAIGTGCFLVARRVFENPEMQKGAFTRKLNLDGTVERGNDISFSERASEQGFEIYCAYDYPCNHFVEVELNEVIGAFKNLYE